MPLYPRSFIFVADWTALSLQNGFTHQPGSPAEYAIVRDPLTSQGMYVFRGGIVNPTPIPAGNVTLALLPQLTAYGRYLYENISPGAGFGGVGRRARLLINANVISWLTGGGDLAGETTDLGWFSYTYTQDGV